MKIIEYVQNGKKYLVSKFDDEADVFSHELLASGDECRIIDIKEFPDPPGKPHLSCSGSGRMALDFDMMALREAEGLFDTGEEG